MELRVRVLVVQETDWIDRNPILHHRMLEAMSAHGDDITVLDHEMYWGRRGRRPIWQGRRAGRVSPKVEPNARVVLIRPGMLRIPGVARLSWIITTCLEIHRYLRRGRPDVIVAYGVSNAFVARLFARWYRIPFVFHSFDSLFALAKPAALRPMAALVERVVLASADHVVIAHRALRLYARHMGVRPERVTLIPNGVTRRSSDPEHRAAVRRDLGIETGEILLLFMGWLYPFCGLDSLVRKLASEPTKFARYKVLVIGDGDMLPALRELQESCGLEPRLLLLGRRPQNEMPGYIDAADVCLLPSQRTKAMEYVVPTKVDEYLELGRPVIATRLPGMEAEFGSLRGMLWIEGPDGALDRIDHELDGSKPDAEVLADLGRSCFDYVRGRDDWDSVTGQFRHVLATARAR
jgi:glycosyltransferase involved in cell wall biosynthesis